MNQFVSNAIRKELEFKKEELREAYLTANQDEGQQEVIDEWENLFLSWNRHLP